MLLAGLLTAVVSPNGAVAALLPMVVVVAVRHQHAPSQMLVPVAFAAHAGSLLALSGSPVNVVVSDAAEGAGAGRFGYFEFALVGVPLLVTTVAVVTLLGPRLLPTTSGRGIADLSAHARVLADHYALAGGDAGLVSREVGVVEVVVAPRSPLVGQHLRPGSVRLGELVVLAVRHRGRDCGTDGAVVAEGDSIVLQGPWAVIDSLVEDRDVLVVDSPDLVRRQAVPLGLRSAEALGVLAVLVVLLATGVVPPAVAGIGAAAATVALRVLTPNQAYRAVSWQTVVLLAGLIPLSTAISVSGAADLLADALLAVVGGLSPVVLLLVVFLVTATLGQVVSNTATTLIVVPIALAAALESGIAVEPVLMTVAVAGSASFLTPIATPANMMVMGPGGYRFGDYWRLGAVLMVAWAAVALLVIPVAWPLQ
jgi:di/tricarboxylate transporter